MEKFYFLVSELNKNLAYETYKTATMQNGWTGRCDYAKNAYGNVKLYLQVVAGTVTGLTIITNLPDGYRPIKNTALQFVSTEGKQANLNAYLNPNGNIYLALDSSFVNGITYIGVFNYYIS